MPLWLILSHIETLQSIRVLVPHSIWYQIKISNIEKSIVQVNLDMTDSMGPGKLVRHMQNPSYTYAEYLICIGLGPSISFVICKKSVVQLSVISKFTCIVYDQLYNTAFWYTIDFPTIWAFLHENSLLFIYFLIF